MYGARDKTGFKYLVHLFAFIAFVVPIRKLPSKPIIQLSLSDLAHLPLCIIKVNCKSPSDKSLQRYL